VQNAVPRHSALLVAQRGERISDLARPSNQTREVRDLPIGGNSTSGNPRHDPVNTLIRRQRHDRSERYVDLQEQSWSLSSLCFSIGCGRSSHLETEPALSLLKSA